MLNNTNQVVLLLRNRNRNFFYKDLAKAAQHLAVKYSIVLYDPNLACISSCLTIFLNKECLKIRTSHYWNFPHTKNAATSPSLPLPPNLKRSPCKAGQCASIQAAERGHTADSLSLSLFSSLRSVLVLCTVQKLVIYSDCRVIVNLGRNISRQLK